jgi:hypothetical protein
VIASDPARFRPLMPPAIAEKLVFVAALVVLYGLGRVASSQLAFGARDLLFGVLFTIAFFKSRSRV